jgi:hypothetical protein
MNWMRGRERRKARAKKSASRSLPGPEKVADRPHGLTILTTSVTAVAALSALAFSFRSFEISSESLRASQRAVSVSERSLVLGQRAYASVKNGTADVRRLLGNEDGAEFLVSFRFDVVNFGNIPAYIEELTLTAVPQDETRVIAIPSRKDALGNSVMDVENPGVVEPHHSVSVSPDMSVRAERRPAALALGALRPRVPASGSRFPLRRCGET